MSGTVKALGIMIIFYGTVAFLINFGLWVPPFIGSLHILWNPLDVFLTPRIVPNINIPWVGDIIRSGIASLLDYVFAFIYSVVLGILGFLFLLH